MTKNEFVNMIPKAQQVFSIPEEAVFICYQSFERNFTRDFYMDADHNVYWYGEHLENPKFASDLKWNKMVNLATEF